jgi:hypothetical protein
MEEKELQATGRGTNERDFYSQRVHDGGERNKNQEWKQTLKLSTKTRMGGGGAGKGETNGDHWRALSTRK